MELIDGQTVAIDSFKIWAQNSLKNNLNQAKIETQNQRKEGCLDIQQQLEESGNEQLSLTDPDARSVVLHRNIVNVGYNVQAACDSKHKLLVEYDTGDVNSLSRMAGILMPWQRLPLPPKNCSGLKGWTSWPTKAIIPVRN